MSEDIGGDAESVPPGVMIFTFLRWRESVRLKVRHRELHTIVYHLYGCTLTKKRKKKNLRHLMRCMSEWPVTIKA